MRKRTYPRICTRRCVYAGTRRTSCPIARTRRDRFCETKVLARSRCRPILPLPHAYAVRARTRGVTRHSSTDRATADSYTLGITLCCHTVSTKQYHREDQSTSISAITALHAIFTTQTRERDGVAPSRGAAPPGRWRHSSVRHSRIGRRDAVVDERRPVALFAAPSAGDAGGTVGMPARRLATRHSAKSPRVSRSSRATT